MDVLVFCIVSVELPSKTLHPFWALTSTTVDQYVEEPFERENVIEIAPDASPVL